MEKGPQRMGLGGGGERGGSKDGHSRSPWIEVIFEPIEVATQYKERNDAAASHASLKRHEARSEKKTLFTLEEVKTTKEALIRR